MNKMDLMTLEHLMSRQIQKLITKQNKIIKKILVTLMHLNCHKLKINQLQQITKKKTKMMVLVTLTKVITNRKMINSIMKMNSVNLEILMSHHQPIFKTTKKMKRLVNLVIKINLSSKLKTRKMMMPLTNLMKLNN